MVIGPVAGVKRAIHLSEIAKIILARKPRQDDALRPGAMGTAPDAAYYQAHNKEPSPGINGAEEQSAWARQDQADCTEQLTAMSVSRSPPADGGRSNTITTAYTTWHTNTYAGKVHKAEASKMASEIHAIMDRKSMNG
ncbi:Hypothetical protein D9617_1g080060 [Elsinoe fawcettii]|nr:Hypothetical protein D9617_1g080060 [Elsinoe fawcettii]